MHISRLPLTGKQARARLLPPLCLALLLAACEGGGTETRPNPTPGVSLLNPAGVMQGSAAFTLTVIGSDFVQGAAVQWNGASRPTTFVSATQLTAQIGAADVEQAGTARVTVFNPAPGGGTSNAVEMEVSVTPPAQITGLDPATVMVDVGGTVTVTGTGFTTGSQVALGGTFRPATTFVSSTQVRFTLGPLNVPFGGFSQVTVLTPDGVPSNPLTLAIANPAPVVVSATPAEAVVEQDSLVVQLAGSGFVQGTTVRFNGGARTTRRVSPTQVNVTLTAADLRTAGTHTLTAVNGVPGGGAASVSIQLVNPAPVVSAVTPAQAQAAQDSLVVRLAGSGFVAGTAVRLNGSPRQARRISSTEMEAVLTAEDLSVPGTYTLTAVNPQPGGGTSGGAALTLTAPVPQITTLPAGGATAGGGGYTLVVHGTGFVRGSRIRWNGVERTTRYVSGTRLEMDVAAADVASPRTVSVTVHTPGGGTSGAAQVTVRTVGAAAFTSVRSLDLPARDIVYDAGRDRLYASLDSTAAVNASSVVAINPNTGLVTAAVAVGGNPGKLALSDDGTTLWVAVDGTGQVRRLALPSLTPGTSFALPDRLLAGDLKVMPGRPGTVAVALRNDCCSPRYEGVALYDDGVRRARVVQGHTGPNTIAFDETGSAVYGLSNEGSAEFYTLRVLADGLVIERETRDLLYGGYDRMQYAGGRAYSFGAPVADAARHERVGSFTGNGGPSSMALDPVTGRVFYVELATYSFTAFDMNTFDLLGSADLLVGQSQHPALSTERLVRWGTDGLALSDGQQIHLLRTAIAGP